MKVLSVLTAVYAFTAMPAVAQSGSDWSGFYGGITSGEVTGMQDYFDNDVPRRPGFPTKMGGPNSGVFLGYNLQNGGMVYGIEVTQGTSYVYPVEIPAAFPNRHSAMTDAKARVGYAIGDALVYAAGGWSGSTWTENTSDVISTSGWNYGVGVDYALTDTLFVGVEYLHRELASENFNYVPSARFESSLDEVSLRIGARF